MSDLRTIIIDGEELEVAPGLTVLQACEVAGREIPRFCYHERLSIAGNCRMCLIEAVGAPKPMASCAMQVRDLRGGRNGEPPEIRTNSALVKKAREGVMEFLLINHPLDCPICDQGGECDLQDQAMAYGVDFSRFREPKRAMDEIYLGSLIKTEMTRCIQCTRCVRFATEVAGVPEIGCTGRGEDAEITSYLNAALASELQGNMVDLCPVGALTSRPYAFAARPWELKKHETIDVMDALGSNIRVDVRGANVMRILPRNNDDVNEEWISDKTRYVFDGLARQRLDRPYIREGGQLRAANWDEAFAAIRTRLEGVPGEKVGAIAGDLVPIEAMFAMKQLLASLGSAAVECRWDGAKLPLNNRSGVIGSAAIADIDSADMIMLIGANPRHESPVLNARIRRAWMRGTEIGLIGPHVDLTYPYVHMGAGREILEGLVKTGVSDETRDAKNTLVILGMGALTGGDGAAVLANVQAFCEQSNSRLLILHTGAARVGGMEIGFAHEGGLESVFSKDVVFLLGADEIDMSRLEGAYVVYQGHHGDAGAHRADVILPSAAYTEQSGLYMNMEGRVQLASVCTAPPGDAREDWAIIRALSGVLGQALPFNSLAALGEQLLEASPAMARMDEITPAEWQAEPVAAMGREDFAPMVGDFYLTNPIARASGIMAELSAQALARNNGTMAAE